MRLSVNSTRTGKDGRGRVDMLVGQQTVLLSVQTEAARSTGSVTRGRLEKNVLRTTVRRLILFGELQKVGERDEKPGGATSTAMGEGPTIKQYGIAPKPF